MYRFLFLAFCLGIVSQVTAQNQAVIKGIVTDSAGHAVESATVVNVNTQQSFITGKDGRFTFSIQSDVDVIIAFSCIGYLTKKTNLHLNAGTEEYVTVKLSKTQYELGSIVISEIRDEPSITRLNPIKFESLPTVSSGVEAYLKFVGASSNSELTSQYNVRGGNYDENLVYVNDFEIYRPQLVRSGQQEGLSFINADLVSSLAFSTGGFQAKYGDKMSSVLDINYKKADSLKATLSLSLLGESGYVEGSSRNHLFRYLIGIRQKSNQYLLSTQDTKGDYKPSFTDIQSLLSWDLNEKNEVQLILNYSHNQFQFVPSDRTTTFGLVNTAIQLDMYFDGQEIDQFNNEMAGISLTQKPNDKKTVKWLASVYQSNESETYDIIGQYFLGLVQTNLGSQNFGQILYGLGIGTTQDWARNYLTSNVTHLSNKSNWDLKNHFVQLGADFSHQIIQDQLSEWENLDSAFYSLPYKPNDLEMFSVLKTKNDLSANEYSAFIQDTWVLPDTNRLTLNYGFRVNYRDMNHQFILSPRTQLSWKPIWKHDMVFRSAVGFYDQPPFYRELRDLDGVVHKDVRSQRSIHLVFGTDYNFTIWNRPFKFVSEIYYKYMYDLNPYEIDNVRIRYFADNSSYGYAYGVDLRLNGELVQGSESWVSLSYLKTQENLKNDFYFTYDTTFIDVTHFTLDTITNYPGYIPRPTDQRVNFAMFFQDYVPNHENFKVHLNFLFGSSLPFGPPDHRKYLDTLRVPPYRRVDIGFSSLLFDQHKHVNQKNLWSNFQSIWLSIEIFNLLQIQNTVSYLWVKDSYSTIYAVPNYLTSRRINVRLNMKF